MKIINFISLKSKPIIISGVLLIFSMLLMSCDKQKFIAPKNHNYNNIKVTNKLFTESKKFPLVYNERYDIPAINVKGEDVIQDLSPPNYFDHSESESLLSNNSNKTTKN